MKFICKGFRTIGTYFLSADELRSRNHSPATVFTIDGIMRPNLLSDNEWVQVVEFDKKANGFNITVVGEECYDDRIILNSDTGESHIEEVNLSDEYVPGIAFSSTEEYCPWDSGELGRSEVHAESVGAVTSNDIKDAINEAEADDYASQTRELAKIFDIDVVNRMIDLRESYIEKSHICFSCYADQVQLVSYDTSNSHWRCRHCSNLWTISG